VVFDDHFTTVPFMEKNEVPPHWAWLVKKLCEKVTEEHYELAKTWLFPDAELGDILLPEQNPNVSNKSNGTLLIKKQSVMIPHKICSLPEYNLHFMLAFLVIQMQLEYLRTMIISNAPYCLLSYHLAMEKYLLHKVSVGPSSHKS
jgi:hypothetical protein